MNVDVELPEDIARLLQASWKDMSRRALEAIALEGYRTQALTRGQLGRLLGLNILRARGRDGRVERLANRLSHAHRTSTGLPALAVVTTTVICGDVPGSHTS